MSAIPSLRTWVTGEIVTAAEMNTNIRDSQNYLIGGSSGQRPTFTAHGTATSCASGATTTLVHSNIDRDTDSGYSGGTYTIQTSGFWLFTAAIQWPNNGTGTRYLTITGGNSPATMISAAVDPLGRSSVSQMLLAGAGGTVNVQVIQNSGGALTPSSTSFGGIWVGA